MAKVYYRKYKTMLDEGMSLKEVLSLVDKEVPVKWRQTVKDMLQDD